MKKLILSLTIILSSSIIFLGCSNTSQDKNNQGSIESEKSSENNSINSNNGTSKIEKNNNTSNNETTKIEKNNNTSQKKDSSQILLNDIRTSAKNGEIINSKFKIGQTIDTVISKLGNPSSKDYVKDAKGTYFTFKSDNVVFGCNKGDQIFEVRSFDKRLNNLDASVVEKFFGKPNYKANTKEKENILGYKINDNYKLLLVFNSSDNKLNHYSVFDSKLTKNSMANDPGRNW